MSKTVQQILSEAIINLIEHTDSPEIDAEVLLSHSLEQSRAWLLAYQDEQLNQQQEQDFEQLIKQRQQGTPIAYILGEKEFWSLALHINKHTLIPRPETEVVVEICLDLLQQQVKPMVADLGTGSGAIALALASELDDAYILATDQSAEALAIAQQNAARHQLNNIHFLQSNWFEQIPPQEFDLICSNPPYIAVNDHHLNQGDIRFEPNRALVSGFDGLFDLKAIASNSGNYLKENGWLVLEHGYQQEQKTQQILKEAGFQNINTQQDYTGNPRVTYGQKCHA